MKALLVSAAAAVAVTALALSSTPAPAKGCLKGAVVGGVAGHYVGHHGLLGATAGCVIGHHEAKKHARERERAYREGYGTSAAPYDDHGYGYGPR
jgi:outer membrane lipoprotein SlyB